MPAVLRTPREAWVQAGLSALAANGPEGVRVEVLAHDLGVTKGSFYAHFDSRSQLLENMLDEWQQRATQEVLARVEEEGGDAAARISRAGMLTFSRDLLPIDLAVRSWARHDAQVAARLRDADHQRMDFLRGQFRAFLSDPDEVEARSILAFSLAIGRHFVGAGQGGTPTNRAAYARAVERALFADA